MVVTSLLTWPARLAVKRAGREPPHTWINRQYVIDSKSTRDKLPNRFGRVMVDAAFRAGNILVKVFAVVNRKLQDFFITPDCGVAVWKELADTGPMPGQPKNTHGTAASLPPRHIAGMGHDAGAPSPSR